MKRTSLVLAAAAATVALTAGPALADTSNQTVTGSIASSVAISTDPTALVNLGTMPAVGTATGDGGTVGVTANVAYTLSVKAAKATMTKYALGAYDDAVKLTTPLAVVPTISGGAGVGTAVPAIGTADSVLATGVGGTTDSFTLLFSQATVAGDKPADYRNDLTYTVAATL